MSSPSVPATTVPAGQVNGVHETTVEDVPAPPTAHAEPNGFDEFDPRGSVPGIVCSFSAINTPLVQMEVMKTSVWKEYLVFFHIRDQCTGEWYLTWHVASINIFVW